MVLFVVCDFQNGSNSRTLQNVSINFLLFYKNNGMLKTDRLLVTIQEKGCITIVEKYLVVSVESQFEFQN